MTPPASQIQASALSQPSMQPSRSFPPAAASRRIAAFARGFKPEDVTRHQAQMCGRSLAYTLAVAYAGHVLDYDDVTAPMRGHPSVVLWPALLALAEARGLPGARLAASFVVGIEVICKLSRGIAFDHYARGWHATASIGVLGGMIACGHLLGLNETELVNALGLAVAQAAGSRENVCTEGRSFQAGHACGAAVDGQHGYLALYAGGCDVEAMLDDLGAAPLEIERSGLDVKQYPMCYATHRALDAVFALRREHGLTLSDVERVSVTASRNALVPLVHPRPRSGLEGKFSLAYAMAAALEDGAVTLASFTDAAVPRLDKQATLTDGALAAKLQDCLSWGAMSDGNAGEGLLRRCLGFSSSSVRDLLDTLN